MTLASLNAQGWQIVEEPPSSETRNIGIFYCHRHLENPDSPDAVLSYATYLGKNSVSRERALGKLLSHWWEHKLNICECLGAERGSFQQGFIEAWLA